jgi:hypothetical protein
MRMKKLWLALSLMSIGLLSTGYVFSGYRLMQSVEGLTLKVQVDKENYLPGEIISLHFSIKNESPAPLSLYRESTVWDGNLKVFIAHGTGPFREYVGPGWGTRDKLPGEPLKLNPSQSFETEATVLWNQKIETSHLNELYAKKLAKQRINTDYALAEPGTYYVKAILHNPKTGTDIESRPLLLTVEEPQGTDLNIWKTLKQNGEYALFIQTGGLLEHPKDPKTVKMARELKDLASQNPGSHYTKSIRSSLSKHKETMERTEPDQQLDL